MSQHNFAVQSFCFRGFAANTVVAQKVTDIGLSAIELCNRHADFGRSDTYDQVLADYRTAGVEVVGIGVNRFSSDEPVERQYFDFAKKAGVSVISATFAPAPKMDHFRVAESLAEEYDINLAIHNHGGHHWLGAKEILDMVFANTGPRIGLMLDTAWALDAELDPIEAVQRFGARLYGVHVKDFVFDRARRQEDIVVGRGNLDLPGLRKALDNVGFSGWAILEYEGDVDDPVPALSDCVQEMQRAWS